MGRKDADADGVRGCGGLFQNAAVRGRGLRQQGEQSGLLHGAAQARKGEACHAAADARLRA